MQIHEITFGPKKLNEGLLDTVKSGIKSAATGAARAVAPMVYGDNIKPDWMAASKPALSQAEKLRQQLEKQYGINIQGSKKAATGVPPATATGVPPAIVKTAKQQGGWITRSTGVQIKPASGNNPTMAKYKKNLFLLSNNGKWADQNGRPANTTVSAFLNQALDDEDDDQTPPATVRTP